MITARVTSKSQTTVPRAVRLALRIKPGDELLFEIDGDRAIVTRARSRADAFVANVATFEEWASDADREAYADL